MPKLHAEELSAEALLLDPNNYRFQDTDGFIYAADDRFHEESVQRRAFQRIRQDEGLQLLKNSILRNGFVPVERIVVRPYKNSEGKYVVIDGNRRLTAVKWILEDQQAGVHVDESVLASIAKLPVVVAEQDAADEAFRASLMGIRHVSGTKEWGGYQRAKLIVDMRDKLKLDAAEVAGRLGLSAHEVNRRFRAFKALQQMQEDEEYGDYALPTMYPLFHEAVSLPIVRTWLDWHDDTNQFANSDNLVQFYDLITPFEEDSGVSREPKIQTYSQVRELRNILAKPEAKRILLDPTRSFQDALTSSRQEEISRLWVSEVGAAIQSLETMGIKELKTLNQEDVDLLEKLERVVQERIADHTSLMAPSSDRQY
jgi:hypothetical protein